jgi:regulator of sigma E protease
MDAIFGFLQSVTAFLVILTVLVFVHELGHFIVARLCGVRVEVFSIGFGKEIFGWTDRANTRWKFSLIPLGGYVKMFGDANAASVPDNEAVASLSEEEKAYAFPHKSLFQRVLIVAAGPFANFLFAIVLLAGLFATVGQLFTVPIIGEVLPDSAAAEAGLQVDDLILSINGDEIERFEELQSTVAASADREIKLVIERDGKIVEIFAIPRKVTRSDFFGREHEMGLLGIRSNDLEVIVHPFPEAVWQAAKETLSITNQTLEGVWQIITGQLSLSQLSGPIGIAKMSGQVAGIGFIQTVGFMALLSINLGLINLFPIPMLDGGHLLFYFFEGIRGKPLAEKVQEYGFRIGLALVMTLVVVVTFNDLMQLRVFDFLKGLIS